MFSRLSKRYDLANTVLSFGAHHLWRRKVIRAAGPLAGKDILDCACGTGDLTIGFAKASRGRARVTGIDFCPEMLEIARKKARSAARFKQADLLALPYESASFDICSIAFGIRNVSDPLRGLREMARVTRPGGQILILEFGQPRPGFWHLLYRSYSRFLLPRVGGWITGQREAYAYLESSSARFPCGQYFLQLVKDCTEFKKGTATPLFGGIAFFYHLSV